MLGGARKAQHCVEHKKLSVGWGAKQHNTNNPCELKHVDSGTTSPSSVFEHENIEQNCHSDGTTDKRSVLCTTPVRVFEATGMPCTARLKVTAPQLGSRYLPLVLVLVLVLVVRYGCCLEVSPKDASKDSLCFQVSPEDACVGFADDDLALPWVFEECIAVWTEWSKTLDAENCPTFREAIREPVRRVTGALQRAGSPCFVKGEVSDDGAGSSAMRSILTLMMAKEVGCEWLLPKWGRPVLGKDGAVLYCHEKLKRGKHIPGLLKEAKEYNVVCSVIDWIDFFRFPQASVPLPHEGTAKVVKLSTKPWKLHQGLNEIQSLDVENRTWDHLVLELERSSSARFLTHRGLWDEFRRNTVRDVLQAMRTHFHKSRLGRAQSTVECAFVPGRLNFGIHVRTGDRNWDIGRPEASLANYLVKLNDFMDTVTKVAVEIGFRAPMFHVFSESQEPCPHQETSTFDEFPTWPLEAAEVHACINAESPVNCPEVQAGLSSCPPARSGIFHVKDKTVILHVDLNPADEMWCMVHVDGMVAGCSAFGQVATLLSKGIKFFSLGCDGDRENPQLILIGRHYKALPPVAIAEGGVKWIPVNGSWHDPELLSVDILARELRKVLWDTPRS